MTAPGVPWDDRGLLLGDGLFETLRVDRGRPLELAAHLDRLDRGCDALGLPQLGPGRAAAEIARAVAAAGLAETAAAVRITWTSGSGGRGLDRPQPATPRLVCTAAPAPPPQGPAALVTVGVRRNEGSPASRLKTLAYLDNVLARAEARARGADEALMLNNRGDLACASAANLFWIVGDQLFTPAFECGVLDGTVRAIVLARAGEVGLRVHQVRADRSALAPAEAMFLTNSLIGLRPVSHLDGEALGAGSRLADLMAICKPALEPG